MTVAELIRLTDELHPNQFGDSVKLRWINEIDKSIWHEVIRTHEGGEDIEEPSYSDPASDDVLLAQDPWSRLYPLWMDAKIAYSNHEMMQHDTAASAFNDAFFEFRNWYNRTHMPKMAVSHLHLVDRTGGWR